MERVLLSSEKQPMYSTAPVDWAKEIEISSMTCLSVMVGEADTMYTLYIAPTL